MVTARFSHPEFQRAKGEKIILFLRRHWMALLPIFGAIFLLIAIPVVLIAILYYYGLFSWLQELDLVVSPTKIVALFFSLYFLYLVFFFFVAWMQYYLDVTILTNRRIVDIQQINLFNRKVASTDLIYVQDVRSEVKGPLQRFFDYGTVVIQTAGKRANFILEDIPHPSAVARRILITAEGRETKSVPKKREVELKMHEEEAFSSLQQGASPSVPSQKETKKTTELKDRGEINL